MFKPNQRIARLFTSTALAKAALILKDQNRLNGLIQTASDKNSSGKSAIQSVKNDVWTLLSMLKAWISRDYTDVSWKTLILCTGAIVYFVNPADAVPDILPVAGFLDDATVMGFVLASVKKDIDKFRDWAYLSEDNTGNTPTTVISVLN